MSDIVKAIDVENTYLEHRMKDEYPFHLVEKIKECGFDTLDEYFIAKTAHYFDQLEFEFSETPPREAIAEIFRMMDAGDTRVLFVPSAETFVFSGDSKPYNEAYCEENNIPVYPLYTAGGAIVSAPGDFSIVICLPGSVDGAGRFILTKLKEILSKRMEHVAAEGNDILVDGLKVCGSVMYKQNGMQAFAAHFSFTDNTELIGNICVTPMVRSVKVPSYIDAMTVDEFKQEVAAWLRVLST